MRVPRPECPSCSSPVVFWSGYWRHVRRRERERKIFIPRVRCRACGVTHALLPAFVLVRRLDAAEPAGAVIGQVAGGSCGVRRAAAAVGVPHMTARGWVRRFTARAGELAVSFSALAAELGGEVVRPRPDPLRSAVAAVGAAFTAAAGLPGWAVLGRWRFACAVTGGSPAGRQRDLALPDHRQAAFHASQELMARTGAVTPEGGVPGWMRRCGRRSRCTGGR